MVERAQAQGGQTEPPSFSPELHFSVAGKASREENTPAELYALVPARRLGPRPACLAVKFRGQAQLQAALSVSLEPVVFLFRFLWPQWR